MKAVIYARVSSNNQDVENSIQAQVKACKEFADKNKYIIEEIYQDRAESGRVSKRPEFQRMISDAKKKQFQAILIHKFDRFSRSREDSVTYKSLLRKYKVELISVTEPLTDDLYGKLIEGILEVTSEFYSLNLGQETKKGQLQLIERGFHPCGKTPFGYRRKEILSGGEIHYTIEPDPETSLIVEKLFQLSASGVYLKEIHNFLNQNFPRKLWDITSIYWILNNRVYLGENNYKGIIKQNFHPAIVTEELWYKAQRKRRENKGRSKSKFIYPLSGVISCELCGFGFVGNT